MSYIRKPKFQHPDLQPNALGFTRRDYEGTLTTLCGGCGHDLSVLRPGGDEILGTGGNSCGPVGFMNLFSENTNTIAQHGRRGCLLYTSDAADE